MINIFIHFSLRPNSYSLKHIKTEDKYFLFLQYTYIRFYEI